MIYTFLWFWFVFVAACTCASFITWAYKIIMLPGVVKYITVRLLTCEANDVGAKLNESEKRLVSKFVKNFLRRDGIFMIWMVAKNTSDVIAAELISGKEKPHRIRMSQR